MIRTTSIVLAASLAATAATADEVNIYSYRQPELIQPVLDRRFTTKRWMLRSPRTCATPMATGTR